MTSPFPGMNPYLEDPDFWPGVHHWLINTIARFLSPKLRPHYLVAMEVRIYEDSSQESTLIGLPDDIIIQDFTPTIPSNDGGVAVAPPPTKPLQVKVPLPITIRQGYLEVKKVGTGEVITAIEILSPINKKGAKGREKYLAKRERVLDSKTHLVEIDLLRKGQPMPIISEKIISDYRILVSKSETRPQAELYTFNLPDAIPTFPLPLRSGDEILVDLKQLLDEIYQLGSYNSILKYNQEPIPALSKKNTVWLDKFLQDKRLRL